MQDKLLTIQEAGKLLGVSTKTLRRWEARGILIPQRTAGNQRRYTESQIENFKLQKKFGANTEFNPTPSDQIFQDESQATTAVQHKLLRMSWGARGIKKGIFILSVSSLGILMGIAGMFALGKATNLLAEKKIASLSRPQDLSADPLREVSRQVLAAGAEGLNPTLLVNIPSNFFEGIEAQKVATLSGGIITENQDIDAGGGSVFASNLLYGVASGSGILIGVGQTPTITNSGVLTLNGSTADLTLKGSGATSISTSGSTITISSTTSDGDITGVTAGTGLSGGGSSGALTLAVSLASSGTTTTTSSASGLELSSGVSLLRGCSDTQTIAWVAATATWDCTVASGSFTLAGDSGTSQTVSSGDTMTIAGGTNGIDTITSATDIITLNLDTTEIGTTTFGSGSSIVWTFDAGAVDPTIAFASDAITFTSSAVDSDALQLNLTQTDDADATDNSAALRLALTSNSGDADFLYGIDISNIIEGTATEVAFRIGSGWTNLIELEGATDNDFEGYLQITDPTADRTYTLPDASGEICLVAAGNCAGSGTGVTTTGGTANTLAKFTGSQAIGNATITDDGTVVTFSVDADYTFAGSENISLTNTTASTDQISLSVSGVTTDGADAIAIALTQADDDDATDTNSALNIAVTSSSGDADTLNGINIAAITAGTANEYAIQIGNGWDQNLYLNDTTTNVLLADGGTITITDGTNTLCTITDSGTTGDLSCTGNLTGGSSGTSGFWSRSAGGVITKATAADQLSLVYGDAGDVQLEITNTVAAAAPTADVIQLNLTGGSGIITDNVDGIYVNIEGANGTSTDVSAIHVDFDPITGSADDTFSGILIDGITATSAVETALNIGTGWDTILSGTLGSSTTGTINGVSITTGSLTSDTQNALLATLTAATNGTINGLNITPPATTGGTTNGINIGNITTSTGTDTAINIGKGWDTGIYFGQGSGNGWISGTLISNNYTGTNNQSGNITGVNMDFTKMIARTSSNNNITGYSFRTPNLTLSSSDTVSYIGYDIPSTTTWDNGGTQVMTFAGLSLSSPGTLTTSNTGYINWSGTSIVLPTITQQAGSQVTAQGNAVIVQDSAITTGGTLAALNVGGVDGNGFVTAIGTGIGAGTLYGLNINSITTPGAGTETAINIGSGWDTQAAFSTAIGGEAIDVTTVAGIRTTAAIDINENNTTGAVPTIQWDSAETRGGLLDANLTGALITENFIDITTSADFTSNIIDINIGNSAATGDALNISLGNTTAASRDGIDITTGTITTSGTLQAFTATLNAISTGTVKGVNISPSGSFSGGTTIAVDIGNITDGGAGATTTAINIGSGWDTDINLQNGETIDNNVDGTVAIKDGGSTTLLLMSTTAFTINLDDTTTFTEGLCHSGADTETGVVDVGDCDTAPSDLAENFGTTDSSIEAGDIVIADPQRSAFAWNKQHEEGGVTETSKAWIVKSDQSYQEGLIGIVSTKPSQVYAQSVFEESENPRPISLAGRVPTKVSTENGPIKVGDPITSSSVSGVGMKATRSGRVVGIALESFATDGIGKVLVFVNPHFYDPDVHLADNGSLIIANQGTEKDPLFAVQKQEQDGSTGSPQDGSASIVDRIGAFAKVVAANISVGLFEGKDVKTDNLSATNSAFLTSNVGSFTAENATVSGTLSADKIKASSIELLNSSINFDTLEAELEAINEKIAVLAGLGFFNATPLSTNSAALSIAENLMVAGATTLTDAAILNTLSVGDNLTIGSNSIDTIGADLEIQPLGQGGVKFLGGKIQIDTEGNIKVEGNAEFAKDVKVGGVLSAQDVAVERAEIEILSNSEVVASGSSGLVALSASEPELKINSNRAKASSLIFITPYGETSTPLYIKEQNEGYFVVAIKEEQPVDIKFNFLIVN